MTQTKQEPAKNYMYRMARDTGFAPHLHCDNKLNLCVLSGCKKVIERCASEGSWIVGIGGVETGECADKIIYIMQVEKKLTKEDFIKEFSSVFSYYANKTPGEHVLVSSKYWYFGHNAIDVPPEWPFEKIPQHQGNPLINSIYIDFFIKLIYSKTIGAYGCPTMRNVNKYIHLFDSKTMPRLLNGALCTSTESQIQTRISKRPKPSTQKKSCG